jgi:hypothetical protein
VTQCQARWGEKKKVRAWCAHGRRGKGTEVGRPEPMPRVGAFDLPEVSTATALLHNGADPPCDWLLSGLLREPVLNPKLSALKSLPSTSRFIRQSSKAGNFPFIIIQKNQEVILFQNF